jgi:DNA-binding CsgD family transcriptional regulator
MAELMDMLHVDAEDFSALMSQVMERLRVKRQRQAQRYE